MNVDYPQGQYLRPTLNGQGLEVSPFNSAAVSIYWTIITCMYVLHLTDLCAPFSVLHTSDLPTVELSVSAMAFFSFCLSKKSPSTVGETRLSSSVLKCTVSEFRVREAVLETVEQLTIVSIDKEAVVDKIFSSAVLVIPW